MKKLIILAIVVTLVLFVGCQDEGSITPTPTPETTPTATVTPEETPSYTDVSPQEAKELIGNNPDIVIIDVSPNYDEGHLPGAVNYYVGDGSLDTAIPSLAKDAMYLVYCHFESASRAGAQKLVDAGFTNVYRLAGDYSGWVDAGFPVET